MTPTVLRDFVTFYLINALTQPQSMILETFLRDYYLKTSY